MKARTFIDISKFCIVVIFATSLLAGCKPKALPEPHAEKIYKRLSKPRHRFPKNSVESQNVFLLHSGISTEPF